MSKISKLQGTISSVDAGSQRSRSEIQKLQSKLHRGWTKINHDIAKSNERTAAVARDVAKLAKEQLRLQSKIGGQRGTGERRGGDFDWLWRTLEKSVGGAGFDGSDFDTVAPAWKQLLNAFDTKRA